MPGSVRILVCGSPEGGDDAAALIAAAALPERPGVTVEEVGQLSAEHLLDDPPETVRIVVDCVAGLPVGEILELPLAEVPAWDVPAWDVPAGEVPGRGVSPTAASSHALSPGQAIALAAALGGLHPADRFIGVGGASFGQGEPLSAGVAAAMGDLCRRLTAAARAATRTRYAGDGWGGASGPA